MEDINSDDDNKMVASQEKKQTDDSVLKLVEEHRREKEEALNKILQLEKELESKKMEMKKMSEELEDKCSELQYLEEFNLALIKRESQSKNEIREARKVLITEWKGLLSDQMNIRVKSIGKIDDKPLKEACEKRFSGEEAKEEHEELYSKWQEALKDPEWHPFKHAETGDKMKDVVDEEDEKLKKLGDEWGEEVKNAVKTALEELNEFNPSGLYSVPVLWNYKEAREATLKEVIDCMMQQFKTKRKRIY